MPRRLGCSPRIEVPERGSGATGNRGDPGVRGQMGGGHEVFTGDFGEDLCAGPDLDAGHRRQDLRTLRDGTLYEDPVPKNLPSAA